MRPMRGNGAKGEMPAAPADSPASASRAGSVGRRRIERIAFTAGGIVRRGVRDQLCAEEPLEIVLAGQRDPVAVTMRTPGADFDLIAGFLLAEGMIEGPEDLLGMRYCSGDPGPSAAAGAVRRRPSHNRVEVRLAAPARALERSRGHGRVVTSSCGVCSLRSIEEVMSLGCPEVELSAAVPAVTLLSLPGRLRGAQSLFERTGGLHAAALFDPSGRLLCIREDVGRHNAMDKLVGAALLAGELPLRDRLLLLSGRLSFELVQKASRAGVPVVAGVSAPSTLAVELAERVGITLVGFLRDRGFNVYAGFAGIDTAESATGQGEG